MNILLFKVIRNLDFDIIRYKLYFVPFIKDVSITFYLIIIAFLPVAYKKMDEFKTRILVFFFLIFSALYIPNFSESRMALIPSIFLVLLFSYRVVRISNIKIRSGVHFLTAVILLFSLFVSYNNLVGLDNVRLEIDSINQVPDNNNDLFISAYTYALSATSTKRKVMSHRSFILNPDIESLRNNNSIYFFQDYFYNYDSVQGRAYSEIENFGLHLNFSNKYFLWKN